MKAEASAAITVNIYDVVKVLRAHYSKKLRFPVGDVTVTSFSQVVLSIKDETLTYPVRHHLYPEHGEAMERAKRR